MNVQREEQPEDLSPPPTNHQPDNPYEYIHFDVNDSTNKVNLAPKKSSLDTAVPHPPLGSSTDLTDLGLRISVFEIGSLRTRIVIFTMVFRTCIDFGQTTHTLRFIGAQWLDKESYERKNNNMVDNVPTHCLPLYEGHFVND